MAMSAKERRNLFLGLGFLGPNIIGFLTFTVIPLVLSMCLAFTNWDLKLHNMFRDDGIQFVGISNFVRLFQNPDFFRFFGNTLFFMMGIPFGIAGSLGAALLLNMELKGNGRVFGMLIAGAVLFASTVILAAVGFGGTAMIILLCSMGGVFLLGGVLGGSTVYRTLFFIPNFTSGVAVYILWKKLYNPQTGPVNTTLAGPLSKVGDVVNSIPPATVQAGMWACCAAVVLLFCYGIYKLRCFYKDGAVGWGSLLFGLGFLSLPIIFLQKWIPEDSLLAGQIVLGVTGFFALFQILKVIGGSDFPSTIGKGFGTALMLSMLLMIFGFMAVGFGLVFVHLPAMAQNGLTPPAWLSDYHWAKPAIMIMGLWGAIGSNNMLLYIAGLSNVPQELYEAADIDGASGFQRFWHVTWPQLAPVTFFIFVMSVIGGLQGGFEMARTMTRGGPAGSTTTLSYFIYTEGFETGRLGFASAVAWALFALVFMVTMFNWRFGSRYVND